MPMVSVYWQSRDVHDSCDENSMSRFRYRSEHGRTNVGHLPSHVSRCLSILIGIAFSRRLCSIIIADTTCPHG
jgi:hypothetical protein